MALFLNNLHNLTQVSSHPLRLSTTQISIARRKTQRYLNKFLTLLLHLRASQISHSITLKTPSHFPLLQRLNLASNHLRLQVRGTTLEILMKGRVIQMRCLCQGSDLQESSKFKVPPQLLPHNQGKTWAHLIHLIH